MNDLAQNLFLGIGIDKYTDASWSQLDNPVIDVETLGNILCQKYGFEQMRNYLINEYATRGEIHEILSSAIGCLEYDNLIIYFAGHGQMWPNDKGNWVPHDGTNQNHSWVSSSAILDHLSLVKAKHIMIIHDCCFSGAFTIGQPKLSLLNLSEDELELKASRIIFTSGEVKKVSDGVPGMGSPFSKSLCEYLENNTKPALKVSKLIEAVTRTTISRSNQKPLSSEINNSDNENGEMILRLLKPLDGGDQEVAPECPLPALPEGPLEIPRTVTAKENQQSIAQLMFELETYRVALEDVLRKEKRIVLLGVAGAGKSYQMLQTARKMKSIEDNIPLFKRLNGFSGNDIYSFLGINPERPDLERFTLFLDGLDEVSPEYFIEVVNAINALGEKHPLLSIVVSCRTNFYEVPQEDIQGSLNGFSIYYLNDIRATDILNHASDKIKINADDFLQKAHANGLSELLHNPFFLNLLFQHFIDYGNLDVDRGKLMEIAVDMAIGNNPSEIYSTLERLAFIMETMGRNFLTDDQIQSLKLEHREWERLKNVRIFYKDENQAQWRFEHNNIQEYLAAKVLSKLNFEELIATISFDVSGQKRVKPTWLNTVAFFSSVGNKENFDKLFDWIVKNDNEVVVRLEPHRLTEDQRFLVFRGIFDFYADKGLWLRSNLFNTIELARFARLGKTLDFLIEILANKQKGRVAKLNAIHVLFVFDIDGFESFKPAMLQVLMDIIQEGSFAPEDTISVLGLIAQLKLADRETIDFLIQKYSHSRNAYLRAGIYKIIADYGVMDDYISVLLDGLSLDEMKYGDNDRTDDNLMDESFNLRRAIEKISSFVGLKKFIEGILVSRIRRYTLTRDNRELLPKLVNNAISNFTNGNGEIYDLMLKLYLSVFEDYDEHLLQQIGEFFKQTDTVKDLLLYLWHKTDKTRLGWNKLTLGVLDQDFINQFIALCKSKDLEVETLKEFHQILFYQRHSHAVLLEQLEDLAKKQLDIILERPAMTDWQAIEKARAQRDFNLLFDKNKMIAELKHTFEKAGTEKLTREHLHSLMSDNYHEVEGEIAQSVFDLLRDFTDFNRTISLEEILNWIENSKSYSRFTISRIKTRLSGHQQLEVDEAQKKNISDWCLNVGDDMELLWFFLHKLGIGLREDQLLELTKHPNSSVDGLVDQPGSLEMLEAFLNFEKLKPQVLKNLAVNDLSIQGWISNIAYCIRKGIKDGFLYLINALATRQQEGYKDKELLEFWYKSYPDLDSMKKIITVSGAMEIKWKAINLLKTEAAQRDFLVDILKSIMYDGLQELLNRQQAANILIELGDLNGFEFLATTLLEVKDPRLDFRWGYRNMGMINHIGALEKLMDLLYLSKTPEFKKDIFNDLESIVLNALVNVGLESEENSSLVISSLEAFMEKHIDELPHLNFLHFTIAKIRDGFAFKKTMTFDEAVALHDNLKFS